MQFSKQFQNLYSACEQHKVIFRHMLRPWMVCSGWLKRKKRQRVNKAAKFTEYLCSTQI